MFCESTIPMIDPSTRDMVNPMKASFILSRVFQSTRASMIECEVKNSLFMKSNRSVGLGKIRLGISKWLISSSQISNMPAVIINPINIFLILFFIYSKKKTLSGLYITCEISLVLYFSLRLSIPKI